MVKNVYRLIVCAALVGTAPVAAATITGGNAVIERNVLDTFGNFTIRDGNNPISGNGRLTGWSIFAQGPAFPVQLLIFRGNTIVQSSAVVAPVSAGVQSFALGPNFTVQAGDLVGFYSQNAGAVAFTNNFGGPISYTPDDSGPNNTSFVEDLSRTYSISVTGIAAAVPEPATWGMMILGFGIAGAGLRRRRTTAIA